MIFYRNLEFTSFKNLGNHLSCLALHHIRFWCSSFFTGKLGHTEYSSHQVQYSSSLLGSYLTWATFFICAWPNSAKYRDSNHGTLIKWVRFQVMTWWICMWFVLLFITLLVWRRSPLMKSSRNERCPCHSVLSRNVCLFVQTSVMFFAQLTLTVSGR